MENHFGMEHPSAGDPYTNRGRTEEVWSMLSAFGFPRASDDGDDGDAGDGNSGGSDAERAVDGIKKKKRKRNKKIAVFEGKTPNPCFEAAIRNTCKLRRRHGLPASKFLNDDEFSDYSESVTGTADDIRSSYNVDDFFDENSFMELKAMSDADLVRDALSVEGLCLNDRRYYFSSCRDELTVSADTWHCRICGECQEWREWHCKGCNECKYGMSIPCSTCSSEEYEKLRAREFGY